LDLDDDHHLSLVNPSRSSKKRLGTRTGAPPVGADDALDGPGTLTYLQRMNEALLAAAKVQVKNSKDFDRVSSVTCMENQP
jgi:hypothetical protein